MRESVQGMADLEAWENAVRTAVLSAGARCLSALVEAVGSGRQPQAVRCSCGERMVSRGLKRKDFLSILGAVSYQRSLFQCPACGKTRYPGDEVLDLVGTSRSPGLRRMMAQSSFQQGCEDLQLYAGLQVSAKDLERVAETLGQDMERWRQQEQETLLGQPPQSKGQPSLPILYIEPGFP